jgi:calcium-dependent protein kinase
MYVLLCGSPPFYAESVSEVFKIIKRGTPKFQEKSWSKVSPEARDLITRLLVLDPKKRLSSSEALKHPWFQVVNKQVPHHINSDDFTKVVHLLENYSHSKRLKREALKIFLN